MKQVLIRKGAATVSNVPAPSAGIREVLVQVHVSCLSVGTEMSGVRSSAIPLWKKVIQQPEKVITTLKMASTIGLNRTWSLIEEKIDTSLPTGYSAAGTVIAVGKDIHDFQVGDRVACAGAQCAYHAEFIRVPQNLCVKIPDNLCWDQASTVTLGAIALQGVRRATPTMGEVFVVIGLGILGQLTVQLLKANGCRAIGVDPDKNRVNLALGLGMDLALDTDVDSLEQVARLTDGIGADGVIVTAATPSHEVMSSAFKVCRKKGRVVLVGDVGLNLNRADFYVKEIDFFISTSYGPGRYDHIYEEQGIDYPVSYVRWTENRNMSEYLRALSEKRVDIKPLISEKYPIDEANLAYASLNENNNKPMMVLLNYPEQIVQPAHTLSLKPKTKAMPGKIRLGVLGAGAFARSAHLPNIKKLSDRFILQAVSTRSGHTAAQISKQFGASYCSTDFNDLIHDPDIDAVIISTRHNLHANQTLDALRAGKHVLVEKPLALSIDELEAINDYFTLNAAPTPILLTGYNRRFSPYATQLQKLLSDRSGPFMLNYRMNAGYIPLDNWVHGVEGGGRNIGEACHIYDLFTFLANSTIEKISTHAIKPKSQYYSRNDNFMTTMTFTDGSVAILTYTALGSKEYPKEMADLYVDGKTFVLNDYYSLDAYGSKSKPLKTTIQEKGLMAELNAFADAINSGEWPIPWWQQLQSAKVALIVEQQINSNDQD